MDNDAKNVSVETLKWYSSCEIEIGPLHSPDIKPIENVWENIKEKIKWHEFKNFDELKSRVKNIYDEIIISAIQNWVDSVKDSYQRVIANWWKYLNC